MMMKKFCLTMICVLMMAGALGACSKKTESPSVTPEATKAPTNEEAKDSSQGLSDQLTDLFGGAFSNAINEAKQELSGVTDALGELGGALGEAKQDALDAANGMIDGVKQEASDVAGVVNEALDGAKQDAADAVGTVNDALDGAKQEASDLTGIVNDALDGAKQDAADAIGGIGNEFGGLIVPEGALADANYAGYVGVWQLVEAEIEGSVMTGEDLVDEFLVFSEDKTVRSYRWLGTPMESAFSPDMKIEFDKNDMPSAFSFDQDGYPYTYTVQSMDDYETLTIDESFFYGDGSSSAATRVYKKLPAYDKDSFIGFYSDENLNTMEISENADGSLNVNLSFYRLAAYDGLTGVVSGRGLYICDKDANGNAVEILISRDGDALSVNFVYSEFEYIHRGEVFEGFVSEEDNYTVFTVPRAIVPETESNFSNEDGVWYITDALTDFTFIVDDATIVKPVDGIGVPDYTVECSAYEWVGKYLADKDCGFHADDCILVIVTGEHIDEINTVNDRSFYDL